MTVFEAGIMVKDHVLKSMEKTTIVHSTGVYGIDNSGTILKFENAQQALLVVGKEGWVFSYVFRNGIVEVTPKNVVI
jgi:hypothetical protein